MSNSSRIAGLACVLLSACGVDTTGETSVALTATPAPIDPFMTCVWNLSIPVANKNIAFTGYGYAGELRGFRIHDGNYVDTAGVGGQYIEYTVEVIWSLPGCSGTIYKVRFPVHGLADHAEIEVRGSAGALKGRLVATKGSLPVLYNQANVALPTHKRGPFVITSSMVGGASGMSDTIAFTLLDQIVLDRLPYPTLYNGGAVTGHEAAIATVHTSTIAKNEYLYSLFAFRKALESMSSAERQAASDSIDLMKDEPGPLHGDMLWEEHHHISHSAAVGPASVAGEEFGAFWNGHRNMLRELERYLRTQPIVPPFGRVPAWDSALAIPAEFAIGVVPPRNQPFSGNLSGGTDMETAYKAANVCASFPSSASTGTTLADRLLDEEVALWADVAGWHNNLHGSVGGDMGPITYSASTPIFYPWHTLVDTIWRNWQLCEAAYHPNRYSYDDVL
ncbi:MAG TPA: tyrosinase family protein [Kofleriaceae bacterium]|nr:tyrosinase family protein [Kofleriaceae bacterium]